MKLDDLLGDYYNQAVEMAVAASRPEVEVGRRRVRDWIESVLVTPQGTRNLIPMDFPATRDLDNRVVKRLIDVYLVRREERSNGTRLELSHDRLIGPILRANADWRVKNFEQFQYKVAEWIAQRGANARLLLGPAELLEAEQWALEHRHEITREEREFLDACRRALDVECRANLSELGWGVIFAHDADPAVRDALRPLLDHRRAQATAGGKDLYKESELTFGNPERPTETAQVFLTRHKVSLGATDWTKLPYYLLIVGDPARIPFEFQYGLDMQYAVGRIHLDTADEYARYAEGVLRAERGEGLRPRRVALFGPMHPRDPATKSIAKQLVVPLAATLNEQAKGWEIREVRGPEATKARLASLLGPRAPGPPLHGHARDELPRGRHAASDRTGGADLPGLARGAPERR